VTDSEGEADSAADARARQYVVKARGKGSSDEQIKRLLVERGWSAEQVNALWKSLDFPTESKSDATEHGQSDFEYTRPSSAQPKPATRGATSDSETSILNHLSRREEEADAGSTDGSSQADQCEVQDLHDASATAQNDEELITEVPAMDGTTPLAALGRLRLTTERVSFAPGVNLVRSEPYKVLISDIDGIRQKPAPALSQTALGGLASGPKVQIAFRDKAGRVRIFMVKKQDCENVLNYVSTRVWGGPGEASVPRSKAAIGYNDPITDLLSKPVGNKTEPRKALVPKAAPKTSPSFPWGIVAGSVAAIIAVLLVVKYWAYILAGLVVVILIWYSLTGALPHTCRSCGITASRSVFTETGRCPHCGSDLW